MGFKKKGRGGEREGVGRQGGGAEGCMNDEERNEYNRSNQATYRGQVTPPVARVVPGPR